MKGDRLVIEERHVRAARQLMKLLLPEITGTQRIFTIAIAGESGSGKSEIASVLTELLAEKGIKSIILQLDDYFVHPPKTNAEMRRRDIQHVGPSEARLELVDRNLRDIRDGKTRITKPLVIYDDNSITEETVELEGVKVAIVDGTYTALLKNVQQRIFIDRTYVDTKEARRQRGREEQDACLERVLEIEHRVIASHRQKADIIVTRNYGVRKAGQNDTGTK